MSNRLREIERVFKALANGRRLMIVWLLSSNGKTSVGDIADKVRLSFTATSRHMRVLVGADIVQSEQVNTSVYYSLASPRHTAVEAALRSL